MSSSAYQNLPQISIDHFPDEVLEHIFTFLSFEQRKLASLVCHRWNRLTPKLGDIKLDVEYYRVEKDETALECLLSSEKQYRHIRLFSCPQSSTLVLLQKFSKSLKTLQLECCILGCVTIPKITEILRTCSSLESLDLSHSYITQIEGKNDFSYCAGNLKCLKVSGSFPRSVEFRVPFPNLTSLARANSPHTDLEHFAPRLTELELKGSVDSPFLMWQIEFPNLRKLIFRPDTSASEATAKVVLKFLAKCKDLTVLSLKCIADPQEFVENLHRVCQKLEDFSFEMLKRGGSFTAKCLLSLLELQQLKRLHLKFDGNIVHVSQDTGVTRSLRRLTELTFENAKMETMKDFDDFSRKAFANVQNLKIVECFQYDSGENLPFLGLKFLETVHIETRQSINLTSLLGLSSLPRLRKVILRVGDGWFASCDEDFTPDDKISQVETLIIKREVACADLSKVVKLLPKVFPNLTNLQLTYHFQCMHSKEEIELRLNHLRVLQQLLPNCKIDMVSGY